MHEYQCNDSIMDVTFILLLANQHKMIITMYMKYYNYFLFYSYTVLILNFSSFIFSDLLMLLVGFAPSGIFQFTYLYFM